MVRTWYGAFHLRTSVYLLRTLIPSFANDSAYHLRTIVVSVKWACRNEHIFISYAMHLDDSNKLTSVCFWQLILRRFIGIYWNNREF